MAEKNVEKNCRWLFMGRRKIYIYIGEYTGSTPAFSATRHAAQREVQVCRINRGKVASPARGQLNREN